MIIEEISKEDFSALATRETAWLLARLATHVFIVRGYYARDAILRHRRFLQSVARSVPPSWHPCRDGCPDYHRINDEYPRSWVRTRAHGFYFHRWGEHANLFEEFKPLFELKNVLSGKSKDAYYDSIPSDGIICRFAATQYPRGGGYIDEHVDPTEPSRLIQTLIQASDPGVDFREGGLCVRAPDEAEGVIVDPYTRLGDLIVLSPRIPHSVSPIDSDLPLDWSRDDGRWVISPVILYSDHVTDPGTRPVAVAPPPLT